MTRLAITALLLSACNLGKPVIVCSPHGSVDDDPRCPALDTDGAAHDANNDDDTPQFADTPPCDTNYVDGTTFSFFPCEIACSSRCIVWNSNPGCQVCCIQLDITQGPMCATICSTGQCVVDSFGSLLCCPR